jgi:hypothetical protein
MRHRGLHVWGCDVGTWMTAARPEIALTEIAGRFLELLLSSRTDCED